MNQIQEIIEMVARRKWLIIVPFVICSGLGAFIAYSLPSYYKSSTLIMVEQQKVPEAYVRPTDETPIERRLNTISQQIMSRTKLEQIINDFNLYKEKKGDLYSNIMSWFGFASSQKPSNEELVDKMRTDIEVNVIGDRRGGDAFRISYIGKDPYVTMQVTNTLSSLFIEENLKVREQYAEGTSEFLSDELEKAKQELENQEKALKGFKERYMGRLPEQMEANLRTLDRLQIELQANHASLKNAEDKKAFLEEQISASPTALQAIHGTSPNPLEVELERLKGELSTLLSTYKENYPDVEITKKRIKDVEKQLADRKAKESQPQGSPAPNTQKAVIAASLAELKSQVAYLTKQESTIRDQISIYQKRVEETPASEQMMADIERDYQTSQRNYQALLEKKLSARLAENMEKRQKGERFKVIDPANVPERPFKPDRIKVTLAGSASGLGIGAALVYLLEFLNPAFRRPEDFNGLLDKPVLAIIPIFSTDQREDSPRKLRLVSGGKTK